MTLGLTTKPRAETVTFAGSDKENDCQSEAPESEALEQEAEEGGGATEEAGGAGGVGNALRQKEEMLDLPKDSAGSLLRFGWEKCFP